MIHEDDGADYSKPVAYDANGNPLYAHPPVTAKIEKQHQVVHFTRAVDLDKPEVSPATQRRHEESVKIFPTLNLSEAEYVIRMVKRHPIGMFGPISIAVLVASVLILVLTNYEGIAATINPDVDTDGAGGVMFAVFMVGVLILLGCGIAAYVYLSNKLFLTNESIIQDIQKNVMNKRQQTVSLANVEDASYSQKGVLEQIFNYGTIRLSTEGEETTYELTYVDNPREHIAVLNNAVESFKNGRPLDM